MQLKILGTRTSQVSNKRISASNYIKIGDKQLLLDCGCGTLLRLNEAKISLNDIDIIFISHFHIDHISDIYSFLWAIKFRPLGRKKDLFIIGPKGTNIFYNTYIKPIVFPKPFEQFNIITQEVEDKMIFDEFEVEVYKTLHTEESLAYKFIENRKILVISGDTDFDEGLIKFSKDADILILECSHANNIKIKGHLIPKECGEIAKKANPKKLILTHFYPTSPERIRLKETQKIFKNTTLAEDLMNIQL